MYHAGHTFIHFFRTLPSSNSHHNHRVRLIRYPMPPHRVRDVIIRREREEDLGMKIVSSGLRTRRGRKEGVEQGGVNSCDEMLSGYELSGK